MVGFFLFWRHGCSAARNSPACKGKSLRCLRKCRFAYIDTSPALSARRHLTAALRPSRWHLGCHSHQTWCAPGHLGAAPCSAHPIQNLLPGTTVAIVGVVWAHGTPQGGGGTECEAVRCGRAGCEGVGRLRCDLAAPTRNRAVRRVIVVEPPGSKPLPTPPNVLPIWPKPDQRRRNPAATNRPHSDLSVTATSRVRSRL